MRSINWCTKRIDDVQVRARGRGRRVWLWGTQFAELHGVSVEQVRRTCASAGMTHISLTRGI